MTKIARESFALGAICLTDLLTTLWFLSGGDAIEGNRVMCIYLDHGVWVFIAAKVALVAGPICVLEWARRRKPAYVTRMLRCTIAAYVALYGTGVWRLNTRPACSAQELAQYSRMIQWASQPPTQTEISQCRQRMRAASARVE